MQLDLIRLLYRVVFLTALVAAAFEAKLIFGMR